MSSLIQDEAALAERLQEVRRKRGFLLPHHGLLALTAPQLLAAYDATYTALALDQRVLSEHDREFVWLAILIATDEALATHHIAKFRKAGGSDAELEAILAITALSLGGKAYRFVDQHWLPHLGGFDAMAAQEQAIRRAAGPAPMRLVHLALASVEACRAAWPALRRRIVAAYADKVPEEDLAEALSLMMFPGSVPHFVDACGIWRALIAEGAVKASAPFRTWASLTGQGGFDEATQAKPQQGGSR